MSDAELMLAACHADRVEALSKDTLCKDSVAKSGDSALMDQLTTLNVVLGTCHRAGGQCCIGFAQILVKNCLMQAKSAQLQIGAQGVAHMGQHFQRHYRIPPIDFSRVAMKACLATGGSGASWQPVLVWVSR